MWHDCADCQMPDRGDPQGTALDVGANIGLWSYAMANCGLFSSVVAFEPNASLTVDLQNARLEGVSIIGKAVSNKAGTGRLRIPRAGRLLLDGWASLEDEIEIDAGDYRDMNVETIRLDDMDLANVSFVKIDVEGHEMSALEGARGMFYESRPTCIVECRDGNRIAVESFFAALHAGYRMVDTKVELGFSLSPGNVLFAAQ